MILHLKEKLKKLDAIKKSIELIPAQNAIDSNTTYCRFKQSSIRYRPIGWNKEIIQGVETITHFIWLQCKIDNKTCIRGIGKESEKVTVRVYS